METGKTQTPLVVVYKRTTDLTQHPNNARTHSKKQLKLIAKSIQAFGFLNPVLIDRNGTIVAGHGRVEAAKLLGLDQVPTIGLENLSKDQIRQYMLADNKLAELADWDREMLAIEFQHLYTLEDVFDIAVTGFEVPEIDLILEKSKRTPDLDDDSSAYEEGPSVTEPGDFWVLV